MAQRPFSRDEIAELCDRAWQMVMTWKEIGAKSLFESLLKYHEEDLTEWQRAHVWLWQSLQEGSDKVECAQNAVELLDKLLEDHPGSEDISEILHDAIVFRFLAEKNLPMTNGLPPPPSPSIPVNSPVASQDQNAQKVPHRSFQRSRSLLKRAVIQSGRARQQ